MSDGSLRRTRAASSRPLPWWPAALLGAGFGLYFLAPHENVSAAAVLALVVYGSAMYIVPACRPARGCLISPLSWSLLLFGVSMVVCPILIAFYGPTRSVLPTLPSGESTDLALMLTTVAFVAFCVGFGAANGWFRRRIATRRMTGWFDSPLPSWLPLLFVGLGLAGLALSFTTPQELAAYFTSPVESRTAAAEGATSSEFIGLVLRPFLGFGIIAAWCRYVDTAMMPRRLALFAVICGIFLSYGTFGFNRASFVYPLVAILAVYSRRIRRIPLPSLIALGVVGGILLGSIGIYRRGELTAGEFIGNSARNSISEEFDLVEQVQTYGGAPQFLAFILTQSEQAAPRWGDAVLSGIASPVPVFGKAFRGVSGTGMYNRWIYGTTDIRDQVIPFAGELFIDLRVPGVLIGFAILGAVVARLQLAFVNARTALGLFVTQYVAMWIAFLIIGSVEVVSQFFIYFMWPIYLVIAYSLLRSSRRQIGLNQAHRHTLG